MTDILELEDMMGDYLDGTLHGKNLLAFEQALEQNSDFKQSFLLFQQTVHAVKALPKQELSEFGRARLQRTLQKEQNKRPVRELFKPLSFAAAAVFLLSIGFVSGQQFTQDQGVVYQALPNPDPQIRLRDASTGGWIELDEFATQVKRSRQNYAIVPQIRIPVADARERLRHGQQNVRKALSLHEVDSAAVQFFAPVQVKENLLDGPEVEFWIQQVGIGADAH